MIMMIKEMMFKMGIRKKCPIHNLNLEEHGFEGLEYYTCPIKGCDFNE